MRRAAASRVFADNDKYTSVRHGNSSSSSQLLSASWLVGLKKPDIYFQHHGFTNIYARIVGDVYV